MNHDYSMKGRQLDVVATERALGVIISSNLKVTEHCYEAYNKANRMLGLLKRTVKYKNPEMMVRLYRSLVRPHLEYSSPVWSLRNRKDKLLLERVHHRFTLLFDDLKYLEYSERLTKLKLWSLPERRNGADLIELLKMVRGISIVSLQSFYSAPQCWHCKRRTSYGNSVCLSDCLSVRPSVRLSHTGILSKRRHVARCSLHCQIAKCV